MGYLSFSNSHKYFRRLLESILNVCSYTIYNIIKVNVNIILTPFIHKIDNKKMEDEISLQKFSDKVISKVKDPNISIS